MKWLARLVIAFILVVYCFDFADSKDKQQVVVDLLEEDEPLNADIKGFGAIEFYKDLMTRWAYGPVAEVRFFSSSDKIAELHMEFANPFARQSVEVHVNDKKILAFEIDRAIVLPEKSERRLSFQLRKGENIVQLRFGKWNGGEYAFAEGDTRPMALFFTRLRIVGPFSSFLPAIPAVEKRISPVHNFADIFRSVVFPPRVTNVLDVQGSQSVQLVGVVSEDNKTGGTTSLAYGQSTRVFILGDGGEKVHVVFSLRSEIEGQSVLIKFNDSIVEQFELSSSLSGHSYSLILRKGVNDFSISYSRWETSVDAPYYTVGRPSAVYQSFFATVFRGKDLTG